MLPEVYSCESGIHHNRSMAKTNYRGYLKAAGPLKKYIDVLRPLLAVRWLEQYGTAAPIEFQTLLTLIADQPALTGRHRCLLEHKRQSPETGAVAADPRDRRLHRTRTGRLEAMKPARNERQEVDSGLSRLFRTTVDGAWNP